MISTRRLLPSGYGCNSSCTDSDPGKQPTAQKWFIAERVALTAEDVGNLSADRSSSGDASKRSSGTWGPDDYDVIDAMAMYVTS
jgi:hypothetical protein